MIAIGLVAALLSPASAAPKTKKAKAAFDDGIAAYAKNDYAGAAGAFGRSFGLEEDVETLFAWAQAERQAEHCEKAIELYRKLLGVKLPDANRQVVTEKLAECLKIVAAKQPPPGRDSDQEIDQPEPPQPPRPRKQDSVDQPPPRPRHEAKSRFSDPLGGVLVGLGAVGLGAGGYFLVKSHSAATDSENANDLQSAVTAKHDAKSQGQIGVIAAGVGGAVLVLGIVRYATRKTESRSNLSLWMTPDSAGVFALGRF